MIAIEARADAPHQADLTPKVHAAPEEFRIVEARFEGLLEAEAVAASADFAAWIARQVAALTDKIDRANRIEVELRARQVLRAELCWDDDRRLEVEILGSKLGKAPAEGVERLKATAHGCDWMIKRWAMLAHVAESGSGWTSAQRALAFDLLGTPLEFRDACEPGLEIDPSGRRVDFPRSPVDLVQAEITTLKARRDQLDELDQTERAMARADLADPTLPELRRNRTYQAALQRQLRWCLAQLEVKKPKPPKAVPTPKPRPSVEPKPAPHVPEPTPQVKANPVPVLAPKAEVQPRPTSERHTRREAKVEARREARRRKLDRLQA